MTAKQFEKVAIIGMGLIGSSIARAVRNNLPGVRLVAYDVLPAVRNRVTELAICDHCFEKIEDAVCDAELVILCIPVGAYEACAKAMLPHMRAGAIVSDVGSVKGVTGSTVRPHVPAGIQFIPAHPVAGTEHSGPDAGFASLFENRWCIITPFADADSQAVEKVRLFWERLGSNVEIMSPEHHDLVLAITSHVPHLIAYNIVGTAADLEEVTRSEVIKFSAGGFRDFTRIAASDPTMWRDVFLNNKEAVLEMLGRFNEDLSALQRMIRRGDGEGLFNLFTRTRAIRRSIIELGQETAAPDFGRQAASPETKKPSGHSQ